MGSSQLVNPIILLLFLLETPFSVDNYPMWSRPLFSNFVVIVFFPWPGTQEGESTWKTPKSLPLL